MSHLVLWLLFFFGLSLGADVPERKLPAWNFALTLRVGPGEWDAAITEMEALFEYAKEKAMGQNTQLLLRGTLEKMKEKVAELEEAMVKEEEARRKQAAAPKPAAFTDKAIGVKPLKAAMAAKKENVKRYPLSEALRLANAGKLDLKKPFIIKNGLPELETLKTRLTAEELMKLADVQINYFSPVIAKKKRTFEEQQQQDQEQYEFQKISFESWFQECFNHKAKPDFRRMPGYGTEHCEQNVPSWLLPEGWLNFSLSTTTALQMDGLYKMAEARSAFVKAHESELVSLVPEGHALQEVAGGGSAVRLTMGSAGSGEQLKRDSTGLMDALVSGRRRWFFISAESFRKLRDQAKGVLEPASAFQFFEQQFDELKEDFGLGKKGMPFFECNQEAGELLYIPSALQRLALALEDSASVTHQVVQGTPKSLGGWVNEGLYNPQGGMLPFSFTAAACYDYDMERVARNLDVMMGLQEQLVFQIMQGNFGHPQTQSMLVVGALTRCMGAAALPDIVEHSLCPKLWRSCASKLKTLAESFKVLPPKWLDSPLSLPGKDEL